MLIHQRATSRVLIGASLGVLLGWMGLAGVAQAATVTFFFEGNVNAVSPRLSSGFHVGDEFRGSYSFNSLTPDHDLSSRFGNYTLANASFTVAGNTYSMGGAVPGSIKIESNSSVPLPSPDSYTVQFVPVGPITVSTFVPREFTLSIAGLNHFTNDSLPLTPPSLSGLTDNFIRFNLDSGLLGLHLVGGEITSLTLAPVPLPGALVLFGSGLIGLAGFEVRRRLRQS